MPPPSGGYNIIKKDVVGEKSGIKVIPAFPGKGGVGFKSSGVADGDVSRCICNESTHLKMDDRHPICPSIFNSAKEHTVVSVVFRVGSVGTESDTQVLHTRSEEHTSELQSRGHL